MKKITLKMISLLFAILSFAHVTAQCNLNASFTYTLGANGVVNFSSTTTGTMASTFSSWNFGNSTTGFGVAPTATYNTNGTYTVVLTAMNVSVFPACQSSATVVITVNSFTSTVCNLVANCTYSFGPNGSVNFLYNTSTGTVPATTYTIDFGDNTSANTIPTIHSYSANGSYTVTLTANNNFTNTCISTKTFVVTYVCYISAVSSASAICPGDSVLLSASGTNGYLWNTGSTSPNITVSPLLTTVYTVTNNTFPCFTTTHTLTVIVHPQPTITAVSSPSSVCVGQIATLTANGANTYTWSTGTQNSTISVVPSANATYTVAGKNNLGCASSQTLALAVFSLPVISVVPVAPTICLGDTLNFLASGANTYTWDSGVHTAAISVTPSINSTYTVSGTNGYGCVSTQIVAPSVLPLPVITVLPASPTICAGSALSLVASGANLYLWKPNNNVGSAVSVSPSLTTNYTVVGTDANNCANQVVLNVTVQKCTGIQNNGPISNQTALYPNPSMGVITAEFEFDDEKEIVVTNLAGSLIAKITSSNRTEHIDLSSAAKGVYFIRITTKTFSSNHRMIIQ